VGLKGCRCGLKVPLQLKGAAPASDVQQQMLAPSQELMTCAKVSYFGFLDCRICQHEAISEQIDQRLRTRAAAAAPSAKVRGSAISPRSYAPFRISASDGFQSLHHPQIGRRPREAAMARLGIRIGAPHANFSTRRGPPGPDMGHAQARRSDCRSPNGR